MGLPSDSLGFLTGQPIELRRMTSDISEIRANIRQIRNAVVKRVKSPDQARGAQVLAYPRARSAALPAVRSGGVASLQMQTGHARMVADVARVAEKVVSRRDAVTVAQRRGTPSSASVGRDAKGRFTTGRPENQNYPNASASVSGFGWHSSRALSSAAAGIEGADPTVRAMNEVAGPMKRGFGAMYNRVHRSGEEKKTTGWMRRVFGELRLFRREESAFNKAANKSLKKIEDKPGQNVAGASGGLLSRIPGAAALSSLPLVGRLFSGGAAAGGGVLSRIGRMFKGGAGAAGEAGEAAGQAGRFSKVLSGGGKLLRRLPFIGALLTGIGAGADVYTSESDDKLTRHQKDIKTGKSVGGLAGTLGGAALGAAIGTMILPGVGTAIGGALGAFLGDQAGQIIGKTVGAWVEDIRAFDVPGKLTAAWDSTCSTFKTAWLVATGLYTDTANAIQTGWDGISKKFTDVLGVLSAALGTVNQWIKDKTGIDVSANLAKAKTTVVEGVSAAPATVAKAASTVGTAAVDMGEKGRDWAAENTTVGRGITSLKNRWGSAARKARWDNEKGLLVGSAKNANVDPGLMAEIVNMESGFDSTAKAGTSSAQGFGQFIDGTWKDTLNKYGAKYGLPGAGTLTGPQAEKYRNDKQVQAWAMAEFTRANVEKGRKYGGADDEANVYAFHNLGDGDAKKLLSGVNSGKSVRESLMTGVTSDKERARVEAAIKNNSPLYGDGNIPASEAYHRFGVKMREGAVFAADARRSITSPLAASGLPPVSASVSVGSVPRISQPIVPEAAPSVQVPLASNRNDSGKQIVVMNSEVGQDLSDRGIAHVVTGGISGS